MSLAEKLIDECINEAPKRFIDDIVKLASSHDGYLVGTSSKDVTIGFDKSKDAKAFADELKAHGYATKTLKPVDNVWGVSVKV